MFNFPQGIAVDGTGTVYVADTVNNAIRKVERVGGDWVVTTVAGGGATTSSGTNDGINSQARFSLPYGVAVDNGGNLDVADAGNRTIRKITPAGDDWVVSTIAGAAGTPGTNDGLGSVARYNLPVSVTVDGATNVYVADLMANTIRKLTPMVTNWDVSTIAGAYAAGSADGTNGQARSNKPGSIAADSAGRVYVSDWQNSTVRQITPAGTNHVVTTIAGMAGVPGSVDGTGSAARFWNPVEGIGVDSTGTLFVTDNGMIRKIMTVGTNWVVMTIAGAAGATGWVDGIGSKVRFYWPQAVVVDSAGILYVADSNDNTVPAGMLRFSLQLAIGEHGVVLSWPLCATGSVLETASAPLGNAGWTLLTNGVVTSGESCVLTNSPSAPKAFYRLRSPPVGRGWYRQAGAEPENGARGRGGSGRRDDGSWACTIPAANLNLERAVNVSRKRTVMPPTK